MSIELHIEDHVAHVVINRPARRNALDADGWTGIGEQVTAAAHQGARALIVRGAGDHFCAGMDLKLDNPLLGRAARSMAQGDAADLRALIVELKGCLAPIRGFPGPTIAAIDGGCLGGGLELALHCDVRVASPRARFAMPEPRIGFVPDVGGTTLLRRLIGPARASWLILSGRSIDAETALQYGIVEELAADPLAAARALAADMAHSAPTATREVLRLLRAGDGRDLERALALETEAGLAALLSGEVMEGVAAFAERRAPRWVGPASDSQPG